MSLHIGIPSLPKIMELFESLLNNICNPFKNIGCVSSEFLTNKPIDLKIINFATERGMIGCYKKYDIKQQKPAYLFFKKDNLHWKPIPFGIRFQNIEMNVVKWIQESNDLEKMGIHVASKERLFGRHQLEIEFILEWIVKTPDTKLILKTLQFGIKHEILYYIPKILTPVPFRFGDTAFSYVFGQIISCNKRDFICPLCNHNFAIIRPKSIIISCPSCDRKFVSN